MPARLPTRVHHLVFLVLMVDPIFFGVVPHVVRSYVACDMVALWESLFSACAERFIIIETGVKSCLPSAEVHGP
jgi:hypothetical protein